MSNIKLEATHNCVESCNCAAKTPVVTPVEEKV